MQVRYQLRQRPFRNTLAEKWNRPCGKRLRWAGFDYGRLAVEGVGPLTDQSRACPGKLSGGLTRAGAGPELGPGILFYRACTSRIGGVLGRFQPLGGGRGGELARPVAVREIERAGEQGARHGKD